MAFEIVSREEELASLHAFVGEVRGGPAALVLLGDAGIGKSTLWRAGVEDARAVAPCSACSGPSRSTRRSAIPSAGLDRSLHSASFVGAHGRSGRPATPSRQLSKRSRSSAPPAGRPRRAASSDGLPGAGARKR